MRKVRGWERRVARDSTGTDRCGIACGSCRWERFEGRGAVGEATPGRLARGRGARALPFSFVYGGTSSKSLLPSWNRKDETRVLDAQRLQRTAVWTDAKTGLEVRCTSVEYRDFPVAEWTIRFRNGGQSDTPILQDILPWTFGSRSWTVGASVHGCKGDDCTPDSYQPYAITLGRGESHTVCPSRRTAHRSGVSLL